MNTDAPSPAVGPTEPVRADVAPTLQPWLIHALYAAAIVFAAAVLAVGLSERGTPEGTVVVPGSATVRIIIDGPPGDRSMPGDPLSPGSDSGGQWSRPGSGTHHPRWCTEVCPGFGDGQQIDSSRGIS